MDEYPFLEMIGKTQREREIILWCIKSKAIVNAAEEKRNRKAMKRAEQNDE